MKKPHLIFAIALGLFVSGCTGNTEPRNQHLPDSTLADSTRLAPSKQTDGPATDSPAVGTDNIRMDSMNNSSR